MCARGQAPSYCPPVVACLISMQVAGLLKAACTGGDSRTATGGCSSMSGSAGAGHPCIEDDESLSLPTDPLWAHIKPATSISVKLHPCYRDVRQQPHQAWYGPTMMLSQPARNKRTPAAVEPGSGTSARAALRPVFMTDHSSSQHAGTSTSSHKAWTRVRIQCQGCTFAWIMICQSSSQYLTQQLPSLDQSQMIQC